MQEDFAAGGCQGPFQVGGRAHARAALAWKSEQYAEASGRSPVQGLDKVSLKEEDGVGLCGRTAVSNALDHC